MTLKTNNNSDNIQNLRLSVHVSLTGLSFLITSEGHTDAIYFSEINFTSSLTPEELLLNVQNAFENTSQLQSNFTEVKVIYATDLYTVVPTSLYDDNKASEYLKFNAKILANDFIASDTLEQHQKVVVYVPFVNINNFFFERFGSFEYYHAVTLLLKQVLDIEKHGLQPKMYLNIHKQYIDCIVVENRKLKLCNTYHYKTAEDFIYYILFAFEQLQLNPETIQTVVLGDVTIEDNNYGMLYTYIRHITLYEGSQGVSIENTQHHQHIILKTFA